jgi:2-keto-4-pentenoate hydratase/2-oxohepta-3-ene-1,7-dioic acid hydratase in catechol pathway
MKLVLFNGGRPGLLKGDGVVDISDAVAHLGVQTGQATTGQETTGQAATGQAAMEAIITGFENLRDDLARLEREGSVTPHSQVSLQPPLPRPNKVLCMGGNYREFGAREPSPMWGFLKSSDAVIGPGDTVVLPPDDINIFHHEAELVLVFGSAGKKVTQADAMEHVFGYTCGVDVSARLPANQRPGGGRNTTSMPVSPWKSFETFAPMGPCIVTKDEIADPEHLQIRLWVDGQLRVNYNTDDLAHSIAESIEWASALESFSPGDVLFMGTNHQGLGPMQDGDDIDVEVEGVGRFSIKVTDALKRQWPKGVDELTAQDIREGTAPPGNRQRPL